MKRAKIKEAGDEERPTTRSETMEEFGEAAHDRCSSKLTIAAFKWVQRSHMIHVGTPVIICDDESLHDGGRGCVLQTLPVSMRYIVRVVTLADAGEAQYVDVTMKRSQFKRAGLILMSDLVEPDHEAIETVEASLSFVREERQELDRLQAGHQTAVAEGGNNDCDGKVIYIGDIVIMKDGGQ